MSNAASSALASASPRPATFYPLAGRLHAAGSRRWPSLLAAAGLWVGFFVAPTDAQQGEGYRIIFVHVPASLDGDVHLPA